MRRIVSVLVACAAVAAVVSAAAATPLVVHDQELRYFGDATKSRVFVDGDFQFNIPDVDDVGPGKLLVRFVVETATRAVLKPAADLEVATNGERNPGDTLAVSTSQRSKDAAELAEVRVLTAPRIHLVFDYENDDAEGFECAPLDYEGPAPKATGDGDRCGRISLSLSDIPGIDSDELGLLARSVALPYGGSLRVEGDPIPTLRVPVCGLIAAGFPALSLLDGLCSVRLDAVPGATILATNPATSGFRGTGRFARDLRLPTGTVVPGGLPLSVPLPLHWASTAPLHHTLEVPCAPGETLRYSLEQLAYNAFVRDAVVQGEVVAQILGKRLGFDIRLFRFDAFDLFSGESAELSAAEGDVANVDLGMVGPDDRAPTIGAGGPYSGPEGSPIAFDAVGSGPDGRFDECHPDGEGMSFVRSFPDGSVLDGKETQKTFPDDVAFAATLRATDAAGNSRAVPFGVQVENVAPVAAITAPADRPVVRVGTPVAFAAEASDPGVEDVLTYNWAFGDGAGASSTTLERSHTTAHAYVQPCVCTATLDVADDDAGAAEQRTAEVVVFDPGAGKLTGGAKFVADAESIGVAPGSVHTLNATVQYDSAASVPKGMVDLDGGIAGLRVRATSLAFLVVTASEAIVEGQATLGGVPGHAFRLRLQTAPDGKATAAQIDVWRPGITTPAAPDLRALGPLKLGMIKTH